MRINLLDNICYNLTRNHNLHSCLFWLQMLYVTHAQQSKTEEALYTIDRSRSLADLLWTAVSTPLLQWVINIKELIGLDLSFSRNFLNRFSLKGKMECNYCVKWNAAIVENRDATVDRWEWSTITEAMVKHHWILRYLHTCNWCSWDWYCMLNVITSRWQEYLYI